MSSVNVCLRKVKGKQFPIATDCLNNSYMENLVRIDEGYKMLKNVRSSPAFWESRKKDLMAMIRQLGPPTFLITLTANEKNNPELLAALYRFRFDKPISPEEAMVMDDNIKTDLIRNDPVMCARYFDYKARRFMHMLKQPNSIFARFHVCDTYSRVEFQLRGSPHEHMFIWFSPSEELPKYDIDSRSSKQTCINFIDQFISCQKLENDPYIGYQMHRHTHTCYKTKGKNKKCRFDIPHPVLSSTHILDPLEEDELPLRAEAKKNYKAIKELMEKLFKEPAYLSFENILAQLHLTEQQYVLAIRSSLKKPRVFPKRTSLEVAINAYNHDILHLFESNMDIQFVLNEFAVASYIINYISKSEAGISKLLREAVDDMNAGNVNLLTKLRKIANVFINAKIMSAQEAAYIGLSMALSKSSRETTFINTGRMDSRARLMKTKSELMKLNPESTDILAPDVFDKFSKRNKDVENWCLADYVALNKVSRPKTVENNEEFETVARDKPRVIRYVRFAIAKDEGEYYREQCLLFLPWRNEKIEIEERNCKQLYIRNKTIIDTNRAKYAVVADDDIINIENECDRDQDSNDDDDSFSGAHECDVKVDLLEQAGKTNKKEKRKKDKHDQAHGRFFSPERIQRDALYKCLETFNCKQRVIVMHILKWLRTRPKTPFHIFLSGSAGVGKSTVINALYQLITYHFDHKAGANPDSIKVLLTAFAAKAAVLIGGTTLHTAFQLPVQQYRGPLTKLSEDVTSTIRAALLDLKVLIIDEISMTGSTLLEQVNQRLRQIFGVNQPFGGISVIVVGDLQQLPPVGDRLVFLPPYTKDKLADLAGSTLWDVFKYFTLTEIMRQKDEKEFIVALNNLAMGQMTPENIALINSRVVNKNAVPKNALRLYSRNSDVDEYNNQKIDEQEGDLVEVLAKDFIKGKVSEAIKQKMLRGLQTRSTNTTQGLPYKLRLKIGIRYAISANIDIEDGLVNGTTGILMHIHYEKNIPHTLYLRLNTNRAGSKARRTDTRTIENDPKKEWVPIKKISKDISTGGQQKTQSIREQFPIKPAEASTIHKAQGQSCECICVHLSGYKVQRSMMYVALSRVTSLNGLYLVGEFRPPNPPSKNDPVFRELNRLENEKLLDICFDTLDEKNGPIIAYHNVASFRKYRQHMINDKWYSNVDVLILSETQTISSDTPYLPGFILYKRYDAYKARAKRGVLVFCKPTTIIHSFCEPLIAEDKKYNSTLAVFEIDGFKIITGYKSPQTPNQIFKRQITEAVDLESATNTVLIGDFNFNAIEKNNATTKYLSRFNMRSLLPIDELTTINNTQIDIVFSNVVLECGSYESYFSDHRPIYCLLNTIKSDRKKNKKDEQKVVIIESGDDESTKELRNEEEQAEQNDDVVFVGVAEHEDTVVERKDRYNNLMIGIALEHKNSSMEQIVKFEELSDNAMNFFIHMVNVKYNYDMIVTNAIEDTSLYSVFDLNHDDFQILFVPPLPGQKIGHWIAMHYVADRRTVCVYDSLYTRSLKHIHWAIVHGRYGDNVTTVFVKPKVLQPDTKSCGVFAIAYITTLLCHENPATYEIHLGQRDGEKDKSTMVMRNHLQLMFQNFFIGLFPSQN